MPRDHPFPQLWIFAPTFPVSRVDVITVLAIVLQPKGALSFGRHGAAFMLAAISASEIRRIASSIFWSHVARKKSHARIP
jgi:hypothetical protein